MLPFLKGFKKNYPVTFFLNYQYRFIVRFSIYPYTEQVTDLNSILSDHFSLIKTPCLKSQLLEL
jgi:hypothetical protein